MPKTPDQVKAQALQLQTAAYPKAIALSKTKIAAPNTVAMGVGGGVAMIAYYPKVLKVKAGTTVTFVNKSASEVHNIVFGPKKYVEQWGKKTDMLPAGPNGPEPGHADRPVRHRPEAAHVRGRDDARQRLLRDAARRRERRFQGSRARRG